MIVRICITDYISTDTPKKKNDIYNYYSIAESFRELEIGEIEKLGLKGHIVKNQTN